MMCVHETRNVDYAAYAAAQDEGWRSEAGGGMEQHPVVNVRHGDAEAFCQWLSEKEGKTYRLPTEAEWSAAVGPTEFPGGNNFPPGPRDGNYSKDAVAGRYDGTAPVMSFRANELGIYDLGGNVSEWCQGWYDDAKTFQVLRGASCYNRVDPKLLRSSFRNFVLPTTMYVSAGFRCVLVLAGG